ncbi:ABC transporter ATP-binding protein [Microvirga yunnanensis]|uniref:ABC transporter ATP-binding protein n=1 Tax=Microvirga yunnanensis TaxID=2953740 RepID=UPI0021C6D708|nr:ABC transporter ATP-binding protein [Microvirga sp. HBU65207]
MTLYDPIERNLSRDKGTDQTEPFVVVQDLVKHYPVPGFPRGRSVKSVDGVSFTIKEGEILGLVGESGCGKSTIARVLMRLTPATNGVARVDARNILAMKGEELRRMRRTMQLVFQDPFAALDPRMKIGQSMEVPLAQHGIGHARERRDLVLRMLSDVGLDASFYDRYPKQCSGGQLQRVVIGRALLLKPWFLVCDEPTSALDASMRTQILNLLTDLKRRFSLTMLMISHDLRVMRYMCDRIAVMYLGQIVEIADRDELFENPRHPYTRALIASSMLEESGLNSSAGLLKGEAPSPLNPPSGCRFHTRCIYARDVCSHNVQQFVEASHDHQVRCQFWDHLEEGTATASTGDDPGLDVTRALRPQGIHATA